MSKKARKRGGKLDTSRDHDMCCLFRAGETLAEVASHYGLTRERARQILKRNGISKEDGGKYIQMVGVKEERAIKLQEKREERSMRVFGVSRETYLSIRKRIGDIPLSNFGQIKNGTLHGNVGYIKAEFELTLAEYVDIWESAGYEVGQAGFVFCRKDPKKGFTKENVCIVSRVEMGKRSGNEYGFAAHPENTGRRITNNK